ncbi:MAG: hypothetical protein KDD89_04945, partial [Anaerolineales bacterium]|nr:hypothetical protein [Anaerolineales bacterium]
VSCALCPQPEKSMSDQDEIRIVILNEERPPQPASPPAPPSKEITKPADNTDESARFEQVAAKVGKAARGVGLVAFNALSKVTTRAWNSETRRKAWESEQRKELSAKLGAQAQVAAEAGKTKSKELLDEAVDRVVKQRVAAEKEKLKTKVRETDWKEVAQEGASAGLRGLSAGLAKVSAKLTEADTPPASDATPPKNKNQPDSNG